MSKENENKRKKIEKFLTRHKTGILIFTTIIFFGLLTMYDYKSIIYSKDIVKLSDSLQNLKHEVDSLELYNINLQTQIISGETQIEDLKQKVEFIRQKNSECLSKNRTLNKDLARLGYQINNLYKQYSSLQIHISKKAHRN